MKPTNWPESNMIMKAPPNMKNCEDLPLLKSPGLWSSLWLMTREERELEHSQTRGIGVGVWIWGNWSRTPPPPVRVIMAKTRRGNDPESGFLVDLRMPHLTPATWGGDSQDLVVAMPGEPALVVPCHVMADCTFCLWYWPDVAELFARRAVCVQVGITQRGFPPLSVRVFEGVDQAVEQSRDFVSQNPMSWWQGKPFLGLSFNGSTPERGT